MNFILSEIKSIFILLLIGYVVNVMSTAYRFRPKIINSSGSCRNNFYDKYFKLLLTTSDYVVISIKLIYIMVNNTFFLTLLYLRHWVYFEAVFRFYYNEHRGYISTEYVYLLVLYSSSKVGQ